MRSGSSSVDWIKIRFTDARPQELKLDYFLMRNKNGKFKTGSFVSQLINYNLSSFQKKKKGGGKQTSDVYTLYIGIRDAPFHIPSG